MWGQETDNDYQNESEGIIPTRVGTSKKYGTIRQIVEDHPHACGDKNFVKIKHSDGKGSSPRVWGQEVVSKRLPFVPGIIPTRVGTSRSMV